MVWGPTRSAASRRTPGRLHASRGQQSRLSVDPDGLLDDHSEASQESRRESVGHCRRPTTRLAALAKSPAQQAFEQWKAFFFRESVGREPSAEEIADWRRGRQADHGDADTVLTAAGDQAGMTAADTVAAADHVTVQPLTGSRGNDGVVRCGQPGCKFCGPAVFRQA